MKICVVGAGRWGKNHVRTLDKLGLLGGIVDVDNDALANLKKEYPNVQTYSDLLDPKVLDFDVYTVAVPAEHHFSIAKKLLEAGKHVLVEKPITLNSKDAMELSQLADKKNVVLMVGHVLLFHPAFQKMKELIDSGKIGRIQYIYGNRLNLGTVRKEENSLWSFAPHDISLFQYFIGEYPEKVVSNGGIFLQPKIHDTTMTILHYPGNTIGHIFVSWLHPFKEHRFVIIGSKGMLSFEDSSPNKELFYYEKGIDWVQGEPIKREGPTEAIPYDKSMPLEQELLHFKACIEGKQQNDLINGKKGLEVLKILEEAEKSLGTSAAGSAEEKITKTDDKNWFIHETAIVDNDVKVGEGSKIWHFSHIQPHVEIGKKCIIGQNVNVSSNVKIGNFVKIQNNVSVYEGVELEDYVFCGPSMVFTNIKNPRSKYPQAESKYYLKTLVKEGTSIGANATIVCGITLGKFSFIGAGAVVTKDVPDYAVITGNPGKIVGWMSEGGVKLEFDENKKVFCERSKKWYELKNNKVHELEPSSVKL